MSVAELVYHWRPTFSSAEVQNALDRLEAAGFAQRLPYVHGAPRYLTTQAVLPAMELVA